MRLIKVFLRHPGVLAAAALALFIAGCKSSPKQPPQTLSGYPEVTLPAQVTVKRVQAVAQEFFRSRGYVETESRHVYEFVFDKQTSGGRSARALRVRLRLNKLVDGSWRLFGAPMGVESWRSDLEAERVLPQGASQIQGFLNELKVRIESGS
jgi:hypothetical protein